MITIYDDFLDDELLEELKFAYDECDMLTAEEYLDIENRSNKYSTQSWNGCKRSDNLLSIFPDIGVLIYERLGIFPELMTFFQHPVDAFPKLMTHGMRIDQHIDENFERSGVLYFIGCKGQGTTVGEEYVEWKRNRAIAFDAKILHNACFGGKGRVSLTFFGKKT
jgi:hypothetical protein